MNAPASHIDLDGNPYTPAYPRPWLKDRALRDFTEIMDCPPEQVAYRLDRNDEIAARLADRREEGRL
jgi:hypothetical protein